jgi:hypothetical protein
MVREGDSRSSATPVPHGAIGAYDVDDTLDAETVDAIAVGVVSPEGIANGTPYRVEPGVVSRIFASWNQLDEWLKGVEALQRVA